MPPPSDRPEPEGKVADAVSGNWVDSLAHEASRPFLRLSRADRPIGTWLLLWPGLWSIVLASHFHGNQMIIPDINLLLLFSLGAIVMRGAGCVVNDLWDRDADGKVKRTKKRPIPSGKVSVFGAIIFLFLHKASALTIF